MRLYVDNVKASYITQSLCYPPVNPSIIYAAYPLEGKQEGLEPIQADSGREAGCPLWPTDLRAKQEIHNRDKQPLTIWSILESNLTCMWEMWEEAGVPGENPPAETRRNVNSI